MIIGKAVNWEFPEILARYVVEEKNIPQKMKKAVIIWK